MIWKKKKKKKKLQLISERDFWKTPPATWYTERDKKGEI